MRKLKFEGELIRDARGREAVCFTTDSGVQAIVATSIPESALVSLIRKLERKIAVRKSRAVAARSTRASRV